MVAVLFDSCILIDYLNGIEAARIEVEAGDDAAISIISWIEVMSGAPDEARETTRQFLGRFELLPLGADVAELAVQIRRDRRLKLPDALIAASAQAHQRLLITRDEKAFGPAGRDVRFPYRLHEG